MNDEKIELARQQSLRAEDVSADLRRLQELMAQAQTVGDDGTVMAAAGVVPTTDASPPRSRGFRNAVDEIRASSPALIEAASRGGPPPEMFPGWGDQPRATASGIDPAALRGLPWRAKLASAWTKDRYEAFQMAMDFGGVDGEDAAVVELGGHPAVRRHVAEVEGWCRTSGVNTTQPMTPDEVSALFPPAKGD